MSDDLDAHTSRRIWITGRYVAPTGDGKQGEKKEKGLPRSVSEYVTCRLLGSTLEYRVPNMYMPCSRL